MSRKRKMPKRKSIVTCMADIPNFTKGKDYRVLGHAPKYRLILTNDKGKREFPLMKNFKVTIKGNSGILSYEVCKTEKGANGFAKRIANEAFFGEEVQITIVAI